MNLFFIFGSPSTKIALRNFVVTPVYNRDPVYDRKQVVALVSNQSASTKINNYERNDDTLYGICRHGEFLYK